METRVKTGSKKRSFWRIWHRWVGLVFSVFILLFSVSGIILNHRSLFSSCEVSRSWLPQAYHIENWNQGIVKGTLSWGDSLLAYGQSGVWLTDSTFSSWKDMNTGFAKGIDNRKITNLVQTGDGQLWCSALYDIYRYDVDSSIWQSIELPCNSERISDMALRGEDTLVVITRSTLYEAIAPEYKFTEKHLQTPEGYESKVSLFKTVWMLHSGELFGTVGRLVVDALGIVLIVLCLTGLVFFTLPYCMRRTKAAETRRRFGNWMKWNLHLHNKLGAGLFILTITLSVSGMCLRPPLMVPLVMTQTKPLPGTALDQENVMHDKLRGIRWDKEQNCWLLSTSEGFYKLSEDLSKGCLYSIDRKSAPPVSPMGITVFRKYGEDWLVGSMSGLFLWNPMQGKVTDYFTGQLYEKQAGYPVGSRAVMGWSADFGEKPIVFEYSGSINENLPPMPEVLRKQPMSLWNFALELHVGRCYEPFLGSVFSVLFVFISGLILTLTLVSGYIIYRRGKVYAKPK